MTQTLKEQLVLIRLAKRVTVSVNSRDDNYHVQITKAEARLLLDGPALGQFEVLSFDLGDTVHIAAGDGCRD